MHCLSKTHVLLIQTINHLLRYLLLLFLSEVAVLGVRNCNWGLLNTVHRDSGVIYCMSLHVKVNIHVAKTVDM